MTVDPLAAAIRFVNLEARLADESRYGEWEELVTDDMHYWVPAGPAEGDPADQLSYINDNRARLHTRIAQLQTGKRHAQTPISPMRRLVSNVEILDGHRFEVDGDEITVGSNFVLYELAVQATHELRVWPGRVTHRLRRVDGNDRMAAKWVELVTATSAQPNLTFLI
ncbi:MAG: aromatic-ring-hydroxylating dioxygenase subunit beta [Acidimicrobiales bacterium]